MKTFLVAAGGLVLLWWLTKPVQAAALADEDEETGSVGPATSGTLEGLTTPDQVRLVDRLLCRCLYVPGVPCACSVKTPPYVKPYIGIVQADAA